MVRKRFIVLDKDIVVYIGSNETLVKELKDKNKNLRIVEEGISNEDERKKNIGKCD